jgi:chromosome segregation ATPase
VTTLDSSAAETKQQIGRLEAHIGTLNGNVGALGSAIGKMDARLGNVEKKVDKLQITSDDTRDMVKLGLEGLEGLRESTAADFKKMSKEHDEQIDLLKITLSHVRKRVARVERRKPRSR